jgi:hypothetical protein
MITEIINTTKRNTCFSIPNEVKNLERLGSDEFKDGLANNLTFYLAEFILDIPVTPYYYRACGDRLYSQGFGINKAQEMLSSFAKPYFGGVDNYRQKVQEMPIGTSRASRTAAEAKGFYFFGNLVEKAQDGDYIAWASPALNPKDPDSYSITYLGQKRTDLVEMVACKNYLPLAKHFEFMKNLGADFSKISDKQAADLVLTPLLIESEKFANLQDLVLSLYFDNSDKTQLERVSQDLQMVKEKAVLPYIPILIKLMTTGASKDFIDTIIDQIEMQAIRTYFGPPKKSGITSVCLVKPDDQDDWVICAWQTAKQAMAKNGGSCPALESQSQFSTVIDRMQTIQSIQNLINITIIDPSEITSESDAKVRCEGCPGVKIHSCCKNCTII